MSHETRMNVANSHDNVSLIFDTAQGESEGRREEMRMELRGLEPLTSSVQGRRSPS